jgi:SAM-dependent methyltransferase
VMAVILIVLVVQVAGLAWVRKALIQVNNQLKSQSAFARSSKSEKNKTPQKDGVGVPVDSERIKNIEEALERQHKGLQAIYSDVSYLAYYQKLVTKVDDSDPDYARYLSSQLENTLVKKYYWGREKIREFPLIDLLGQYTDVKGKKVLCVGARNEDEINYFYKMKARQVVGIDLFSDSDQILVMDMHDLKFEDDSFDIVYSRHSYEHSIAPYKAASEFMRVCRGGGMVIVEVPGNYKGGGDYTVFTSEHDVLRYFEKGVDEVRHLSISKKEENTHKMDILRMAITVKSDILPRRPFPVVTAFEELPDDASRKQYMESINSDSSFAEINSGLIKSLDEHELPTISPAGVKVLDGLKKDGIAIAHMNDFFPDTVLPALQDRFATMLDLFEFMRGKGKEKSPDRMGKAVYMDTLKKGHKFRDGDILSEYLGIPEFAAISASYMGMVPRYVGASVWNNRPVDPSAERLYSQSWHRDYNDMLLVKVFVYLSDVNEGAGPFEYLKGSHRRGPLGKEVCTIGEDGYRAYPTEEEMASILALTKEQDRLLCIGGAGSLVFADTYGLHRGGYCQNASRHMIMSTFSTDYNVHRSHFEVAQGYSGAETSFMKSVFGIADSL